MRGRYAYAVLVNYDNNNRSVQAEMSLVNNSALRYFYVKEDIINPLLDVTFDGKHIYSGRYTNSCDILFTFDGKHIYDGRYTNPSDITQTVDDKHIYRGRYKNPSDIRMTFKDNFIFSSPIAL